MSASEIVIGIDFGTTYSGVSWAVNGGAKSIRLINNWPNPQAQNATSEKVPSVISYASNLPGKWGYEVNTRDPSFKWIKVLLEPDSKYARVVEPVRESNELLRRMQMNPVDVVADYLRLLWSYTMEDIRKKQGDSFKDIYSLKVVVTVPALWSPAAKDKTLQAAKAAGMSADISIVSEPEAAALATLSDKEERDELQPGDCFVVCDAGGGTVDLISYEIEDVQPLKIKECAVGDGGLCGSVFIDTGFKKWLKTQVGASVYDGLKESAKRRMESDFEYQIKRGFDPSKQQQYTLDLKGVPDNPAAGINEDEITVKTSVIRTVFEHVCGQIETLIDKQIAEVQRSKKKVKTVLLVGGFGESGYLFNRLEQTYKSQSISLLQVSGAWSAICRGATMWGLEHSSHSAIPRAPKTVTSRLARFNFGFIVSPEFDGSKHAQADRWWDSSESVWRGRELQWLLKKGEETNEDEIYGLPVYDTVQVSFFDSGYRHFTQRLYYSEDFSPDTRPSVAKYKELCNVNFAIDCDKIWSKEASFRNKETKIKHRNVTFILAFHVESAALQFLVTYRDELAAACEAKYPDKV